MSESVPSLSVQGQSQGQSAVAAIVAATLSTSTSITRVQSAHSPPPLSSLASCCTCHAAHDRCSDESRCACKKAGRPCDPACETVERACDCLNRQLCRCTCVPTDPSAPVQLRPSTPTKPHSKSHHQHGPHRPQAHAQLARHCENVLCECHRLNERCTMRCGCRALCVRRPTQHKSDSAEHSTKMETKDVKQASKDGANKSKLDRPSTGCRCAASKRKACRSGVGSSSPTKCPCRLSLQHCTMQCKCQCECTNTQRLTLSKTARHYFVDPSVDAPRVVVLILVGKNSYRYGIELCDPSGERRPGIQHAIEHLTKSVTEAFDNYKHTDLEHIFMYMSKSPCYHQDCMPPCQVLNQCDSSKACARLIAVSFGQWRRALNSTNVQMSLKFLAPYTRRGDLYTQQAIMHMMQVGICVEPLVMKEWIELMGNDTHSKHQGRTQRHVSVSLWAKYTLDRHVRHSQQYVNACRRQMEEPDIYWTSAFHDLLKKTTMTASLTQHRFEDLAIKLNHMAKYDKQHDALTGTMRSAHRMLPDFGDDDDSTTVVTPSFWDDDRQQVASATDWMNAPSGVVNEDELFLCAVGGTTPVVRATTVARTAARRTNIKPRRWFTAVRGAQPLISTRDKRSRSITALNIQHNVPLAQSASDNEKGTRSLGHEKANTIHSDDDTLTERSHDDDLDGFDDSTLASRKSQRFVDDGREEQKERANELLNEERRLHDATKIILNLSARRIGHDERKQIAAELGVLLERVNADVRALLNYLEAKAAATPV